MRPRITSDAGPFTDPDGLPGVRPRLAGSAARFHHSHDLGSRQFTTAPNHASQAATSDRRPSHGGDHADRVAGASVEDKHVAHDRSKRHRCCENGVACATETDSVDRCARLDVMRYAVMH